MSGRDTYIEVKITAEMRDIVKSWLREHPMWHDPETDGGNPNRDYAGYLGESIVCVYFEMDVLEHFNNKPSHDPGWDFVFLSGKYDCKGLERMCRPYAYWKQNVTKYQYLIHHPDKYLFCDIQDTYTVGWIDGYISKVSFGQLATEHKAGVPSPDREGWVYKLDTLDIPLLKLTNPLYLEK